MQNDLLIQKLGQYGISSRDDYISQAFSRNIGLFSREEQERLSRARVAIPGMGGVGGGHFITMVRTGIGRFHISDFDVYEPANVNRQFGARIPDFGRSKMETMKEEALSINPFIDIKEFPAGINKDNVDDFLDGVDIVLDSLDFFAFDVRRLLFNRAREKGIHVITAGPLGFSSAMLVFAPDKGMGFDEYFNIVVGMKPEEQYLAFALGLAPKATQFKYMDTSKVSFKSKKGPSLYISCQLCCAMAGTEAVRILLGRGEIKAVPYYVQIDPYIRKYHCKKLPMGNRNPLQRMKAIIVKQMLNKNTPIAPEEPEIPSNRIIDNSIHPDVLNYIIQAGIQAPSGDNCQPWKFSYDENNISLYLNEDADRSFFNVAQIASLISCGAAMENMKITATKFKLRSDIQYGSAETGPVKKIASLILSEDVNLNKDPLADFVWKRQTNRKLYKKAAVPSGLLIDLKSSMNEMQGTEVLFITDLEKLKKLALLVSMADRIRTERKDLHEHLFQMIRFSKEEALEKRNGFYIKNLEAGLSGEIFLKTTRSWQIMNMANKLGFGKIVAQAAFNGIAHSSGAGLVVTRGRTREDFFTGGRALERVWLSLTRAGYQMQPMTAVTLFFQRKQLEGNMNYSDPHSKLLDGIWMDYQGLFPAVDFDAKGQVMLFRFGKADAIKHGTLRSKMVSFIK
jgi:molybdopterin/thiamine biosynthesis adenylyltransferase